MSDKDDKDDLFGSAPPRGPGDYDAHSIEVLEGLEPVRRRPGMYIGGIDERALHHLAAEVHRQCHGRGGGGPRDPDRGDAGGRAGDGGAAHRRRQRPRHAGRRASQISGQVGARGDPDHAPFGRQILATRPMRPRAACTASASRWSTRCPARRGRGGAQQAALPPELRARPADLGAGTDRRRPRTGAAPPSPSPPTPRFSATEARFKPARLYRLARSKAYLFAGVEIRWQCDPALISTTTSAGRGGVPVSGRARRPSARADRRARRPRPATPFTGRQDFPNGPGLGRMGGGLAALGRRRRLLLLQHHPDARRRHPRAGACGWR